MKSTKIVVENTLDFDRKGEIVEVKTTDSALDFNTKSYVLKNEKGAEIAYQLLPGSEALLIFQADVPAQSSVTYTLEEGTPAPVTAKTYARFVPERSDDFAWENDIAAFRMYGPALAAIENPSNGVDIWMKCSDEPVIDRIYADRLERNLSYHENHGVGLDCYDVKHTMGAGGIAPYTSDFWIGDQFSRYEIVETGPLRCIFTLIYDTIRVEDTYYEETITITTDAGSILNKAVVRYKGVDKPVKLAGGIYMHQESGVRFYNKENKVIGYAEDAVSNKGVPEGKTYIGVYMPDAAYEPIEKDNQYAILADYQTGNEFTYYFGGGWSKWKFPEDDDWFNALLHFSQSKR
ncbi:MAG: DUF4861 domain-containing protein, partial [Dysgonamonadaceae bacterium]|nr:DUF4861 domain-containing protein [Dysgonamonadaceae bacterium]